MTRTPQWKAERAIRRARERADLERRRSILKELREADKLRAAFDEAYEKLRITTDKPLDEALRG